MRVTIWVNRENEQFWMALENKSGWVNAVIESLIENKKKELLQEEEFIKKYGKEKDEEYESFEEFEKHLTQY